MPDVMGTRVCVLEFLTVFMLIMVVFSTANIDDHRELNSKRHPRQTDPKRPACLPVNIKNGIAKYLSRHPMTIQYRCRDGFELQGAENVTCVHGKWEPPLPYCVTPKGCPTLNIDPLVIVKEKKKGAVLEFSCPTDFRRDGPAKAICEGVKWNKTPPKCTRIIPTRRPPSTTIPATTPAVIRFTVTYLQSTVRSEIDAEDMEGLQSKAADLSRSWMPASTIQAEETAASEADEGADSSSPTPTELIQAKSTSVVRDDETFSSRDEDEDSVPTTASSAAEETEPSPEMDKDTTASQSSTVIPDEIHHSVSPEVKSSEIEVTVTDEELDTPVDAEVEVTSTTKITDEDVVPSEETQRLSSEELADITDEVQPETHTEETEPADDVITGTEKPQTEPEAQINTEPEPEMNPDVIVVTQPDDNDQSLTSVTSPAETHAEMTPGSDVSKSWNVQDGSRSRPASSRPSPSKGANSEGGADAQAAPKDAKFYVGAVFLGLMVVAAVVFFVLLAYVLYKTIPKHLPGGREKQKEEHVAVAYKEIDEKPPTSSPNVVLVSMSPRADAENCCTQV